MKALTVCRLFGQPEGHLAILKHVRHHAQVNGATLWYGTHAVEFEVLATCTSYEACLAALTLLNEVPAL